MFLDLDNTLYDYKSAHLPAQSELVAYFSRQLKMKKQTVSTSLDVARLAVKKRLGTTASSHSRLVYVSDFLRNIDCQGHVEMSLAAESLYWNVFLKNMHAFRGAHDFLLASRESGYTNVLVTDLTAAIQRRKLRHLEMDMLFEVVVTSEESGGDKASGLPEKFLANFLGAVSGICVGDSDHDYLFKDATSFYRKRATPSVFPPKNMKEFKEFSKLQRELFEN
jgi:FMN phosphatase YigB (HAD superfamily)